MYQGLHFLFLNHGHASAWRPHNLTGKYVLEGECQGLQECCLHFSAGPEKKNLLFITDGYTLKSDALIWVILIGTICEQKALAFTSNSLFVEASCQKLNKHVFKCLQTVIKSRRISLSSSHIFVRDTSFLTIVKLGMSTSCFFCNNLFNLFNSFVYLINGFSSDY